MTPVVQTSIETGHKRGIGVSAFLLAIVTAGAMAHVGVRMKGIEVAYDLGKEKRVNQKLEEERRRLNIEIGMLKDPVRVVTFARDTLKMGPPAPGDIVRLAPGTVLGSPAPAAPEAAAKPKRAERAAAVPRPRAAARAQPSAPPTDDVETTGEGTGEAAEALPPPAGTQEGSE